MCKLLIAFYILLLCGCTTQISSFVKSGAETFPPKPASYEVLAFVDGDLPAEDFEVIGVVYAEVKSNVTGTTSDIFVKPEQVVQLLKKEASKHGADAIIDIKITTIERQEHDWKQGEAKAIVFK